MTRHEKSASSRIQALAGGRRSMRAGSGPKSKQEIQYPEVGEVGDEQRGRKNLKIDNDVHEAVE